MPNTWDVRTPSGSIVEDLAGLAAALKTTPELAAKQLLADEALAASAPASLLADVKAAKPKPGGGTPPPISNGSFVSWSGGKGKVDLIVSNGKVPGVKDDVEGSAKTPAARVVVWVDGKPTREKRGFSTHTLKRIAPLDKDKKSDPAAALVAMVAEHETKCAAEGLPEFRGVTGESVKAAYERGLDAYPGRSATGMSAVEWGLGRAEHFVKVASGEIARKDQAGHDTDLLHPEHPFADDVVLVSAEEHERLVKSLMEVANGTD